MHPQTHWAHIVATVEIFTGMSLLALYTGLMFSRFSRPQARFLFAKSAVVTTEDGRPKLMVRVANERQNTISGATAQLWIVRSEYLPDGRERRRFLELKLARTQNPVFALSWTLIHEVMPDSPLYGETADSLLAAEASLVLTLTGLDERSGHFLHARQTYPSSAIHWGCRYVDMLERMPDGQPLIDYNRLDDIEPLVDGVVVRRTAAAAATSS